jgi:hypothetical protein
MPRKGEAGWPRQGLPSDLAEDTITYCLLAEEI